MPKAAAADVIMDVNRDYAVPQSAIQGEGVWIRANGFSIKVIAAQDGGINIRVWPTGQEDGDPIEVVALGAEDAGLPGS